MEHGYILLHKKITKWEWYDDIYTTKLFLHLLVTANHKNYNWHGTIVKRAQTLTSVRKLAAEAHLSIQNVRTSIKRLKSTHEITYEPTQQYILITLLNYDTYQSKDIKPNTLSNTLSNTRLTHSQHTPNTNLNKDNKEILIAGGNGKYPQEWYRQLEQEYMDITNRKPVGSGWGKIRATFKQLFEDGNTVADIIGCMKQCQKKYTGWYMPALINHMHEYKTWSKSSALETLKAEAIKTRKEVKTNEA